MTVAREGGDGPVHLLERRGWGQHWPMQSWTTPRRSAVFAFVLLVATAFGRLGELQESGVSLHWPVAGVIALWALVLRDRAE